MSNEKLENIKLLKESCTRCQTLGVKLYVDDAWLIDIENDELYLDNTDFWVPGDKISTIQFVDWKTSLGIGEDNWLKVPDGVTRIRGGAFKANNLVKSHIYLDLNDLKELRATQLEDVNWVNWVRGNNIVNIHPSSFRNMNYLKRLELESIDSHSLTNEYLVGLPDSCQIYLHDIHTTVNQLKRILMRYKLNYAISLKNKLGIK